MSETTILRAANNKVTCIGWLKAKNLSYGTMQDGKTPDPDVIRGDITIATDENSEHFFTCYASRLTSAKKENPSYVNLKTFMETAVSIAELMKNTEQPRTREEAWTECSVVAVNRGDLSVRDYVDRSGQLTSRQEIRTSFITQLDRSKPFTATATFDVECYINSIVREQKDGEETGRLLMSVWIPVYGGRVVPYSFVVDKAIAEDFASVYGARMSGNIWGNLVNTLITTKTFKQGIGGVKEEVVSTRQRELLVTNASEPYDEESPKAFKPETVQKAIEVRNNEILPAVVAKDKAKGARPAGASAANRPAAPGGFQL